MKENILIVHNHYQTYGGEDSVVKNEVELLLKKGHKVIVYERDNNEIKNSNIFKKVKLLFATFYSKKTTKEVKEILKNNKIDIIHVHNTLPLISPSIYYLAKKNNIPVVQTVHNFRFVCPNGLLYRDSHICEECINFGLRKAIKHSCYRNSKFQTIINVLNMKIHRILGIYKYLNYICLTNFNKDMLLKQGQINRNQVFVKPNFILDKNIKIVPFNQRKNQYIYMGRLDETKGIIELFDAWKDIKEDLIVFGDGPLREWCQNYIRINNLNNIKLMGYQPNNIVLDELSKSKAMILLTKWYEGFPMSIIESYKLGVGVITSNIGNAKDIVSENIGFAIDINKKEELKHAIDYFNQTDLTKEILECSKKYSEDKNYEILESIYKTCLRKDKNI